MWKLTFKPGKKPGHPKPKGGPKFFGAVKGTKLPPQPVRVFKDFWRRISSGTVGTARVPR